MKKPATWLVVGGDGLIGGRLAVEAKHFAGSVVASCLQPNPNSGMISLDLTTGDNRALTAVKPDVAFLCAAITAMQFCQDNPDLSRRTNVTGTLRLASELLQSGCFIIFLSSNTVFDGNIVRPNEDSLYCPTTEYGRQKVSVEQQLLALSGNSGAVAIVRLSKVVAPGSAMVAEFTKLLKAGKPCAAFNDLRMSPVSLSYVTDALLAIAQSKQSGIFHLSGAEEMTYAEFASHLASSLGADAGLVRPISSEAAGVGVLFRPQHPALGMKRTSELLRIFPEPTEHFYKQMIEGALVRGRQ